MEKMYMVTVSTLERGEYGECIDLAGVFRNKITADLVADSYRSKGFFSTVHDFEVGKQYLISRHSWDSGSPERKTLACYVE